MKHNSVATAKRLSVIPILMIAAVGIFTYISSILTGPRPVLQKPRTTSWKTYENKKYLYRLSYPETFKLHKTNTENIVITPAEKKISDNYIYVSVIAQEKADKLSAQLLAMKVGEKTRLTPQAQYIRHDDIRLAQRRARVYKIERGQKREYRCYVEEGNLLYLIGGYISQGTDAMPKTTFEKIINSFRIS